MDSFGGTWPQCFPPPTEAPPYSNNVQEKFQRWPRVVTALATREELKRSALLIKGPHTGLNEDARGLDPVADEWLRYALELFKADIDPRSAIDERQQLEDEQQQLEARLGPGLKESLGYASRVVLTLERCHRYCQGRGADVRITPWACRNIKLTLRFARNLVTWRAFGVGALQNRGELPMSRQFLEILKLPFQGSLSDDYTDRGFAKDVKSQMLQAFGKIREDLGALPMEQTPAQKRRAKKDARIPSGTECQPDPVVDDSVYMDGMSYVALPQGHTMPFMPVL